jgi:hypothetical protein
MPAPQGDASYLSGVFRRATEDIDAFNTSVASIAKRANADLERAAHEITGPIQAVGEEEPKAAGTRVKTHKRAPAVVAASRVIPDISRIEQFVRD